MITFLVGMLLAQAQIEFVLTGSGMDHHPVGPFNIKICRVESYVIKGSKVKTAKDLATADEPKKLRMILARQIPGHRMNEEFARMMKRNHPGVDFGGKTEAVRKYLEAKTWRRGEVITILYMPKVGMIFSSGDHVVQVTGYDFAVAFWNNYFGKHNAEEQLKRALLSNLR